MWSKPPRARLAHLSLSKELGSLAGSFIIFNSFWLVVLLCLDLVDDLARLFKFYALLMSILVWLSQHDSSSKKEGLIMLITLLDYSKLIQVASSRQQLRGLRFGLS